MAPELEKLIQDAKEILQKIAEHPEADIVSDFVIHITNDLRIVHYEIEEDLKDAERSEFQSLPLLTLYPNQLESERTYTL